MALPEQGRPEPAGESSDARRRTATTPEAEIAQLRKSMVQQLTASGRLLQAVFAIDRDYFGSRFHGENREGVSTPMQDLALATKIVETLGEELQGASAFADSPVLRDGVHNLVTSIEALRSSGIELERTGMTAVGLPAKAAGWSARTFPDNNPLACVNESAGFMAEVQGLIARTIDRMKALGMMLQEAERGRSDAENTVNVVNPEALAPALTAELKAREDELTKLRAQARQVQEETAVDLKRMRFELEEAKQELMREADIRHSDSAEVRSLAAEVERLATVEETAAKQRPGLADADDLVISLSVLRDYLSDGSNAESMTTAAESVLLEWSRLVASRAAAQAAELDALAARLNEAHRAAQLQQEAFQRLQAQHLKELKDREQAQASLHQRLQEAERSGKQSNDSGKVELERARAAVKTLEEQLVQARTSTQTAVAEAAKSRGEAANLEEVRKALAAERERAELAQKALAKEKGDAELLKAQHATELKDRIEVETRLQHRLKETEAAVRQSGDAKQAELSRARESIRGLEDQVSQARSTAQSSSAEAAKLRSEVAALEEVAKELAREKERAKEAIAAASAAISQKEALARRVGELETASKDQVRSLSGDRDKLATELAQFKLAVEQAGARERQITTEMFKVREAQAIASTQASEARTAQAGVVRERDELKVRIEALQRASDAAAQKTAREQGELQRTLTALQEQVAELKTTAKERDELKIRIDELRRDGEAAMAKGAASGAELQRQLATLRDQQAEHQAARAGLSKERDELRARLDEMRKSTDTQVSQVNQEHANLNKELKALREAEAKLRGQVAANSAEAARAASKAQETERELAQAREQLATRAREQAQLVEQLRAKEAEGREQARTGTSELAQVRSQVARLESELAQTKERHAAAAKAQEQLTAERNAWNQRRVELEGALEATKSSANSSASGSERIKRDLERKEGEHAALSKRFEEREGQLTAKLTELSRQLGDLKQAHARTTAEHERLTAENQRLTAERKQVQVQPARAESPRETTGVWAKRLADSAASTEEVRQKAGTLERKLDEQRKQLAELEERNARRDQAEQHYKERIAELERKLAAAPTPTAPAPARPATEPSLLKARLDGLESELANERQRQKQLQADLDKRLKDYAILLQQARESVLHAKKRQDEVDTLDRTIIGDLMRQVEALKKSVK